MSKTCVLVIGEDPYEIMKEFMIDREVSPWVMHRKEDFEGIWREKLEADKELLLRVDTSYNLDAIMDSYLDFKAMGPEAYMRYIGNYLTEDEDGNYVATHNPRGFVESYYQSGLDVFLVRTPTGHEWRDSARVEEVDWSLMRKKKAEDEAGWVGAASHERLMKHYGVRSREEFVDVFSRFHEVYVVDERGLLHSPGWTYNWGQSNTPHIVINRWVRNFYNRFIQPLDGDTLLTHMKCRT